VTEGSAAFRGATEGGEPGPGADRLSKAHGALSERSCEGCGERFTPARRDQRHCRAACRARKSRRGDGPLEQLRASQAIDPARRIGAFVYCAAHGELVSLAEAVRRPAGGFFCGDCAISD
jgi:hypothetical protein